MILALFGFQNSGFQTFTVYVFDVRLINSKLRIRSFVIDVFYFFCINRYHIVVYGYKNQLNFDNISAISYLRQIKDCPKSKQKRSDTSDTYFCLKKVSNISKRLCSNFRHCDCLKTRPNHNCICEFNFYVNQIQFCFVLLCVLFVS